MNYTEKRDQELDAQIFASDRLTAEECGQMHDAYVKSLRDDIRRDALANEDAYEETSGGALTSVELTAEQLEQLRRMTTAPCMQTQSVKEFCEKVREYPADVIDDLLRAWIQDKAIAHLQAARLVRIKDSLDRAKNSLYALKMELKQKDKEIESLEEMMWGPVNFPEDDNTARNGKL